MDINLTFTPFYTITYNLDGGTQANNQITEYLQGNNLTILSPTKTDNTFQGWYENPSFTGNAITSTNGLSKDLVLYAKWQSNQPQLSSITTLTAGDHVIYTDTNQLSSLGILNINEYYWLGSYYVSVAKNKKSITFGVRIVRNTGAISSVAQVSINQTSTSSTSSSYTYGLRPVFTLKDTSFIQDNGNGVYELLTANN